MIILRSIQHACKFPVTTNSSTQDCINSSGMIFERENTTWQDLDPSFFRNLAKIAAFPGISYINCTMLRFTATTGTTTWLNLTLSISCIISSDFSILVLNHPIFCNFKKDTFQSKSVGPVLMLLWLELSFLLSQWHFHVYFFPLCFFGKYKLTFTKWHHTFTGELFHPCYVNIAIIGWQVTCRISFAKRNFFYWKADLI